MRSKKSGKITVITTRARRFNPCPFSTVRCDDVTVQMMTSPRFCYVLQRCPEAVNGFVLKVWIDRSDTKLNGIL